MYVCTGLWLGLLGIKLAEKMFFKYVSKYITKEFYGKFAFAKFSAPNNLGLLSQKVNLLFFATDSNGFHKYMYTNDT